MKNIELCVVLQRADSDCCRIAAAPRAPSINVKSSRQRADGDPFIAPRTTCGEGFSRIPRIILGNGGQFEGARSNSLQNDLPLRVIRAPAPGGPAVDPDSADRAAVRCGPAHRAACHSFERPDPRHDSHGRPVIEGLERGWKHLRIGPVARFGVISPRRLVEGSRYGKRVARNAAARAQSHSGQCPGRRSAHQERPESWPSGYPTPAARESRTGDACPAPHRPLPLAPTPGPPPRLNPYRRWACASLSSQRRNGNVRISTCTPHTIRVRGP